MELCEIVDKCYVAVKNSIDFSDSESTVCFMLLIDKILNNPCELQSLPNKRKCAFVLSSIAVSDFFDKFPEYNGTSTGEVVCASGFYMYMNLLESGDMFDIDFPAFIMILHYGREYIGEVYGHFFVANDHLLNVSRKYGIDFPYDPKKKKRVFAKGIELRMIRYSHIKGTSNRTIDQMGYTLEDDNEIPHDYNDDNDPFAEAINLYRKLDNCFASSVGFDFLSD